MSGRELPVELWESILNNLTYDSATLKTCALVCRSWLPTIRRILFGSMKVDDHTNYRALVHVLDNSPGIAACVRSLKICEVNSHRSDTDEWYENNYLSFVIFGLGSLRLLDLSIREVAEKDDGEVIEALCLYPRRLTSLDKFVARISLLNDYRRHYPITWVCKALITLPSTIREIHLHFDIERTAYEICCWERINWASMDTILSGQFTHLQIVTMEFGLDVNTDHYQAWVINQLEDLDLYRRGLLHIVFHDRPSCSDNN